MKALVELLARSLVERPDAVAVRLVEAPQETVIEVQVASEDVGKIIGRGGRVIKAIRTLARAAATRSGKRVNVEVLRP